MELGLHTVYPNTATIHPPDEVKVPSFTYEDVEYTFNRRRGKCDCPADKYARRCKKHRNLARSGCPDAFIEGAEKGILSDGRRVLQLYHSYRLHRRAADGYAAGEWLHAVAFDGENFVLESTHTSGLHDPIIKTLPDWCSWEEQLPPKRIDFFEVPTFIFTTRRRK